MKLSAIIPIIEGRVLTPHLSTELEITCAAASDLMSDVLAFVQPGALLLTGLTHVQVIRTAEMADIVAILFVRGKLPDQEVIHLAEEKNIPLLSAPFTMFELCGRLHHLGMHSCDTNICHGR